MPTSELQQNWGVGSPCVLYAILCADIQVLILRQMHDNSLFQESLFSRSVFNDSHVFRSSFSPRTTRRYGEASITIF